MLSKCDDFLHSNLKDGHIFGQIQILSLRNVNSFIVLTAWLPEITFTKLLTKTNTVSVSLFVINAETVIDLFYCPILSSYFVSRVFR